MKDMDAAAARVRRALERGEQIAVYGDYDVDGITATCLLTDFLRSEGGEVVPYIPDRMEEGYGLNREAVAALHAQGGGADHHGGLRHHRRGGGRLCRRPGGGRGDHRPPRVQGGPARRPGGGGSPAARLPLPLQVPGRGGGGPQAGAGPGRAGAAGGAAAEIRRSGGHRHGGRRDEPDGGRTAPSCAWGWRSYAAPGGPA